MNRRQTDIGVTERPGRRTVLPVSSGLEHDQYKHGYHRYFFANTLSKSSFRYCSY